MILAVNGAIVWDVRKELLNYNIGKLVIISPLMDDKFYKPSMILSEDCDISNNICLDDNVQIVADESSSVIVENGATIGKESSIIATDNSRIYIGKNSIIGENVAILASGKSNLFIDNNVIIDSKCLIIVENESIVKLYEECRLGQTTLVCRKASEIIFNRKCQLAGENGYIVGDNSAHITIGALTIFMRQLYMVCEKSTISIGRDCMFSFYIKMNVGSHRIIDKNTNEDITNLTEIIIGNHFWCGIDATILPGCIVEDGSVIGANTIVNKLIPSNCTCAGNTAKILRRNVEWYRN